MTGAVRPSHAKTKRNPQHRPNTLSTHRTLGTRRNLGAASGTQQHTCGSQPAARRSTMGRNSELIRQWTLLRQLAAVRTNTISNLATDLAVTTRTVRRDLAALQTAGFPIYDEVVNGTKFWRMDPKATGALARSG